MRGRQALAAAALAVLAASGGVLASRGAGTGTYRVTAFFPRVIGLFERSTVRVLGVEVGRVSAVVPEGDRVRVEMRIRKDVRVPASATAVIVPISLISDRYVQLEPVWRGGAYLRDGDVIPLGRTVAPAELDDLLKTLKAFLEAIEPGAPGAPGALGQLVQNADRALGGRGEALGTTVDSLATLLDVLGRTAVRLDSTILSLDALVGVLGRKDAQIAATNRGLAAVLSALAEERGHLTGGVRNLADLLARVGELVRGHRADLLEDLATLARTTQIAVRQKDAVVRNILWLPVLSEGVARATDTTVQPPLIRVRDNQGFRGT